MKGSKALKILQVSPEAAPLAKVGGLADVVGALAKEMARLGHDMRVLLPRYRFLQPQPDWKVVLDPLVVHLGTERQVYCRIWEAPFPGAAGARLLLLEHNGYFDRTEIYHGPWGDHADNNERFTVLSRAALDYCHATGWTADVFHCHDWTTGLLPVYLNTTETATPLASSASVFTIHNLLHQGIFNKDTLRFAGLPDSVFRPDGLESMGLVNMMKGGLYHATKLTTVSPTYAREIQQPELGCGLNHVLKHRAADLIGILNGIDGGEWNPATDPLLPARFDAGDLSGKDVCKQALQERFGLECNPQLPVFGVVARLYEQKGLDLLAAITPEILRDMVIQLVIVGTGDHALENRFRELAASHPGRMGVFIGYDNALAHLVEAGSDVFIMPSRFEPCGLNQMYSMAYGTPPIVRETGGLIDSVEAYVEGTGQGTGFRFQPATTAALRDTIGMACATYYDRPGDFHRLRLNGMTRDLSWAQSAETYARVYQWAIDVRRHVWPANLIQTTSTARLLPAQ